jgi:anti-anti-sigma regulatory factor
MCVTGAVLRTMISDAPFQQTWVLQGRLCGEWAVDLKHKWEQTRKARKGRACVVDLEDVTCVDPQGEKALQEMAAEGAQLVSTRAYMKHLLANLGQPDTK